MAALGVSLALACKPLSRRELVEIPTPWPPSHPGASYFPLGALHGDSHVDTLTRAWYGQHLFAMQEPRLYLLRDSTNIEAIRFVWLRSFHAPVAVRLTRRDEEVWVVTTVLGGHGGYEPGPIVRRDSARVTVGEFSQLKSRLAVPSFWTREGDVVGLDGAEWIFEWARPAEYSVVDRWTPEVSGRHAVARNLGLDFLRVGRIAVPSDEIY